MVCGPRLGTINALAGERRIDVEHQVDAGGVEDTHTLVMILLRVDVVDADRVDAELLHEGGIAQAGLGVDEDVLEELGAGVRNGLVTGLASGLAAGALVCAP